MTDDVISGDSPPQRIILELMQQHPDQWRVKMPDLIHMPSGVRVWLSKYGVYIGGAEGIKLGVFQSNQIRKAALQVTTWQMLALARKAQLEGRDYMNPDHARAQEFSVTSDKFNIGMQQSPNIWGTAMVKTLQQESQIQKLLEKTEIERQRIAAVESQLALWQHQKRK